MYDIVITKHSYYNDEVAHVLRLEGDQYVAVDRKMVPFGPVRGNRASASLDCKRRLGRIRPEMVCCPDPMAHRNPEGRPEWGGCSRRVLAWQRDYYGPGGFGAA
ncbi:hypothetical protein [Nocardia cyriacigeorgica]|uniref:hypothetical protein n=1 Tax=Nocardia cyriacigeorgica TaxID=135487 RepID=UPI002455DE19|nr:hypothetical protein [Nocardia cyriacigeorgica]